MAMTLSDFRQKRDTIEREEQLARSAAIREKLIPLLLADLQGELDDLQGFTLVELCDDLEITEQDYADLQRVAKAIAQDTVRAVDLTPRIEAEKLRCAKLTLAVRRAEQLRLAAERRDRVQRSLRATATEYRRQLEVYRDSHPFFFGPDGEPLSELLEIPIPAPKVVTPPATRTCAICLVDYVDDNPDKFCSSRCEHIAAQHADALQQLGILPKAKGKK